MGDDGKNFIDALNNGAVIHVGNDLWGPRQGYDVYWIDEATAKINPSMHLANDLYWKVIIKDERLIAVLSPISQQLAFLTSRKPKTRERTFRGLILFPLQAIINGHNPNENTSLIPYQSYGSMSGPDRIVGGVTITTSIIAFYPAP